MKYNHQTLFPTISLNGLGRLVILRVLDKNLSRLHEFSGYTLSVSTVSNSWKSHIGFMLGLLFIRLKANDNAGLPEGENG